MPDPAPLIRVVVIDDSAYNRQTITQMLEADPMIQVVGRAGDGDEGLKQVFQCQPDVVTLDLEMPKMDGFTFLRILMSRRATPVLVISSFAGKENVFKALELGALDFIAKPSRQITPDLRAIQEELLAKVKLVRQLRVVSLTERARMSTNPQIPIGNAAPLPSEAPAAGTHDAFRLIAIGASTGGPPALQQLLQTLDPTLPMSIVITQHMPAKFTRAFAERLGRATSFPVKEAEEGDIVRRGHVLVAPGSGSLVVVRRDNELVVRIEPASPQDRFVPNIDRMFISVAEACGAEVLGVVLTGMGGDSGRGVRAIKAAQGRVVAEAAETAVIFGMPQEAIATGGVDEVLPLGQMAEAITKFAKKR